MNFKKIIFSALFLSSFAAQAASNTYILGSGQVVELKGINQSAGTAYYFDFENSKKVFINLSDASAEVRSIKGLSSGSYVVANTKRGDQICQTYHVFENEAAHFGCQTMKFSTFQNQEVLSMAQYTASINDLLVEVKSADGFSKNEQVRYQGKKYSIVSIFENGQVLLKKSSLFSGLDSKYPLTSPDTRSVTTADIEKL